VAVHIGDDTVIGPGLYLVAGDHEFRVPGISFHGAPKGRNEPIWIGRNVWLGARVTILKGVTIGDGAIVAAGSVVTDDIDSCAIVAGAPARFLRWRFEGEGRRIHDAFLAQGL
jgi:acetyltransferase-like isoleucine patch superfamily enzyme